MNIRDYMKMSANWVTLTNIDALILIKKVITEVLDCKLVCFHFLSSTSVHTCVDQSERMFSRTYDTDPGHDDARTQCDARLYGFKDWSAIPFFI